MYIKKISINSKSNKLIVQQVQSQQNKLIQNAKKFEVAIRKQSLLQQQLQQLKQENEITKIPKDDKAILQNKEIQKLKKQLEHITKNFNTISSDNQKKRNHINTLRKERTLYDHIFKTLEYQILDEENQLSQLLKKNLKEKENLQKQQDDLERMKKLTSKNSKQDLIDNLLNEIQQNKTDYKITKDDCFNNDNNKNEEELYQQLYEEEKNKQLKNQKQVLDKSFEEKEKRIYFLEQLKSDFIYYTDGTDIDLIDEYMVNGQEQNDQIYDQYCELEQEFQKITKFNKRAEKEIELCQVKETNQKSIQTNTQQNLIEQNKNLELKVNKQFERFKDIIVFQQGYIQIISLIIRKG